MVHELADLKSYMRITSASTDALLTTYLEAVEAWVERHYSIKLTDDDATEYVDGGSRILYLERRPVTTVTKITDLRTGAIEDSADYSANERGVLRVAEGDPFWAPGANRFKVEYDGGYEAVPGAITLAIFGIVLRLWSNRHGAADVRSKGGSALSFDSIPESDLGAMLAPYSLRRFC